MLRQIALCSVVFSIINYCAAEIYAIRRETQFYFEEFEDAPAAFGGKLPSILRGMLTYANPPDACTTAAPPPTIANDSVKWILLIPRYTPGKNCSFADKVRVAQEAGYQAAIVHNIHSNKLVTMTADNDTGIRIPSVFVAESAGYLLNDTYANPRFYIIITPDSSFNWPTHLLIPFSIVVGICVVIMLVFMIVKYIKDRRRQHRHRLPTTTLNKIPTCKFQKGDPYETCAICLDDYIEGEKLRVLPCNHAYHTKCIDPWLTKNRRVCPVCKRKVFAHDEAHHYSDSESESDDTTPLINSNNRGTQGGTFQPQRQNPFERAIRSISQQSGTGNYVTTSGRHSINGEFHDPISSSSSTSSSSTGSEDGAVTASEQVLDDNLEVVVQSQNRSPPQDNSLRFANPFDNSDVQV